MIEQDLSAWANGIVQVVLFSIIIFFFVELVMDEDESEDESYGSLAEVNATALVFGSTTPRLKPGACVKQAQG